MNTVSMRNWVVAAFAALTLGLGGISPAAAQTVDEIIQRGGIKIGVLAANPPLQQTDASGVTIGYDVDVANRLGEFLGVSVELVPLANAARIPALLSGNVDVLIAQLTPTPERAIQVMFTSAYGAYELSIVAPKATDVTEVADLEGKTIAIPRGSIQDTALSAMSIPNLTIMRFDDDALTAQALLSGQAETGALTAAGARYIFGADSDIEIKIPLFAQYFSMAVRRDATDLRQWLNNAIHHMKANSEFDKIYEKWTGLPIPYVPSVGPLPTF